MLWLELEDQGGKSVGWVGGRGLSMPIIPICVSRIESVCKSEDGVTHRFRVQEPYPY
jgi:hypothetical protein